MNVPWLNHQKMSPICIAVDMHFNDNATARYEFVFENEDYVLKQYFVTNERVTIEDHWNDDVLAYTDGLYDCDNVRCAEMLFQTAHGTKNISKKVVESIIYKLMVGDMKLIK